MASALWPFGPPSGTPPVKNSNKFPVPTNSRPAADVENAAVLIEDCVEACRSDGDDSLDGKAAADNGTAGRATAGRRRGLARALPQATAVGTPESATPQALQTLAEALALQQTHGRLAEPARLEAALTELERVVRRIATILMEVARRTPPPG